MRKGLFVVDCFEKEENANNLSLRTGLRGTEIFPRCHAVILFEDMKEIVINAKPSHFISLCKGERRNCFLFMSYLGQFIQDQERDFN